MNRRHQFSRGFTLIELLVAASLTVVVVALALGSLRGVQTTWDRTQGRLEAAAAGHRVCDQLAQDLRSLRCGPKDGVWLAVSIQRNGNAAHGWIGGGKPENESWNPITANLADARFGVGGAWLRFFAVRPGADARTAESAGPIAIGYQVVRRALTVDSVGMRYRLYRAEATSRATRDAGFDFDADAFGSADGTDGEVGNLILPPSAYVLAEDVVDFGVRCFATESDATSGAAVFPSETTPEEFRARSIDGPANARIPRVVDIMVRILTRGGARELAAFEAGRLPGDWWSIVLANSIVVTQRIHLALDGP